MVFFAVLLKFFFQNIKMYRHSLTKSFSFWGLGPQTPLAPLAHSKNTPLLARAAQNVQK